MVSLHECPVHILIFEAFIREAFPFQQHLVGFYRIDDFLVPKGREGESCVGLFYSEYSKGYRFAVLWDWERNK
jgi:hypothetical protein